MGDPAASRGKVAVRVRATVKIKVKLGVRVRPVAAPSARAVSPSSSPSSSSSLGLTRAPFGLSGHCDREDSVNVRVMMRVRVQVTIRVSRGRRTLHRNTGPSQLEVQRRHLGRCRRRLKSGERLVAVQLFRLDSAPPRRSHHRRTRQDQG